MELKPLYMLRFRYPDGWEVGLEGPLGREEHHFYLPEGSCQGEISGRFKGANHPRRRTDRAFQMDMQGFIETLDGALIMVDYKGYGRVYRDGKRQIAGATWNYREVVGAAWHISSDERYRQLNDSICAIAGEVRSPDRANIVQGDVELVFQVSELIWSPPPD